MLRRLGTASTSVPIPQQRLSRFGRRWQRLNGEGISIGKRKRHVSAGSSVSRTIEIVFPAESQSEGESGVVQCSTSHSTLAQIDDERRRSSTVVRLFSQLTRRLDAFYAAGCVQQGDGLLNTKNWVVLPNAHFAGLPPSPTWLASFGSCFAPFIEEAFREKSPHGKVLKTGRGRWQFQGGPEPMDQHGLAGLFPTIDPRLTFEKRANELGGHDIIPRRGEACR